MANTTLPLATAQLLEEIRSELVLLWGRQLKRLVFGEKDTVAIRINPGQLEGYEESFEGLHLAALMQSPLRYDSNEFWGKCLANWEFTVQSCRYKGLSEECCDSMARTVRYVSYIVIAAFSYEDFGLFRNWMDHPMESFGGRVLEECFCLTTPGWGHYSAEGRQMKTQMWTGYYDRQLAKAMAKDRGTRKRSSFNKKTNLEEEEVDDTNPRKPEGT